MKKFKDTLYKISILILIIVNIIIGYKVYRILESQPKVGEEIEDSQLAGWACLKCGQNNPDRYMSCGNCGTRQGSTSFCFYDD